MTWRLLQYFQPKLAAYLVGMFKEFFCFNCAQHLLPPELSDH